MTVFLTPDGQPFYGGTYFPRDDRHGLPGFTRLLEAIDDAWRSRRDELLEQAGRLAAALARSGELPGAVDDDGLGVEVADRAAAQLAVQFDGRFGGFGGAPKFPPAMSLDHLLRHHLRTGNARSLDIALATLDAMAAGGMYDIVGGGFHRYSVDETWLVPHFEKMLYDNALLVPAYLHGWLVTGDDRYRRVAEETLDSMLRDFLLPSGGFASSLDADTDGVEGLTYTWTSEEGAPPELLLPFEDGRSIIRGELDDATRARLLAIREARPQPALDDKVIASWNGLALDAFAEGARRLGRSDLLDVARSLGGLLDADPLWRTQRDGRTRFPAYLDDYANVAHGLLELHVATGELRWLLASRRIALQAVERFADETRGAFFLTPTDGEELVARRKDLDDNPTPSGNSMLAYVLIRLARIWGDGDLERLGAGVLRLVRDMLPRAPSAFGWALCALDLYLSPPREIAVVGGADSEVARAALRGFDPNAVVAFGPSNEVPLLAGKGLVDGKPAVYVCERFACQAPVTDPAALADT